MKIYFNSDFTITKREYEEYYLGSEYHNKIEVYFPMISYPDYTYIYPVFNVKRPDDRKFGEFALTEYNVENDYIIWRADLPSKALEIEGTLEITILFRYSTDNKYAKVSTGKVLLNVKEAVVSESNIIYIGEETDFLSEIDAIRNEYGDRLNQIDDCLKNGDNKPDTNIFAVYNSLNIYGKNYARGLSVQENNTGIFDNGSSIYLRNNDVSINNKSFNELYRKFQNIYGLYIDFNIDDAISYYKLVPSGVATYATINKVGGMSYKSNNLFNGVYEFGSLNTSTGAFEAGDFGCCSDYIKVDSNTTYSYRDKRNVSANFETIFYVVEYDVNKGFIQHKLKQLPVTNGIYFVSFTTQATTKYIRFMAIANYETEYMPTEAILVKGTYTVSTLNYIEYFEGIRYSKVTNISHTSGNILQLNNVAETTLNGITYSVKDGVITLNGTATKDMSLYCFVKELLKTPINSLTYNNTVFITGKKSETIIDLFIALYDGTSYSTQPVGAITNDVNENTTYSKSFTYSGNNYLRGFSMYFRNGTIFTNYQIKPMLVKGSTSPTTFKPYAVYKNIDLSNYQTLEGYGLGINENCYNYIDFDRNVFVKKVGSHTFTGDERMGQTTSSSKLYRYWCSDLEKLIVKPSSNVEVGNILMAELDILTANQIGADNEGIAVNVNGTLTIFKKDIQTLDAMKAYLKGKTLYYELETPTETPISEIDTIIEVEEGDVITFENEYQNAVPSEIEYQVKVGN